VKHAGWIAAALSVLAAVIWWWAGAGDARSAKASERTGPPPASIAPAVDSVASNPDPPRPREATSSATREDYAARLRAAPDYLEFVRSLTEAASNGDHAAQFYIFRALDYCDDGYRGYFNRKGVRLTLDDALKFESTRWPYNTDEVRRVHARCHTLVETGQELSRERLEWLRLASKGGFPLAQVIDAQRPSRTDDPTVDERRSLVAKAIRSRDPEVIFEIGNTVLDSPPPAGGEIDRDHLAWYLAACARGFDCAAQSEIVRELCRFDPTCQPYETLVDLVRRASGNDFPDLEARARWINEKIDAGDWEALGF